CQLTTAHYLVLSLLVTVLQSVKNVRLETLAASIPFPILFESRRKKLQRFLGLKGLGIEHIWWPILQSILIESIEPGQVVHIAIDRTSWSCINILIVSLIWDKRAWPIYWTILDKKGSSNYQEQTEVLSKALSQLKDYKTIVLGDREFCGVKLGHWLSQQAVDFCLRLKKSTFVEAETDQLVELMNLGLVPGMSLFINEVRVTKQKGFGTFNIACKWQRKYRGFGSDEAWFILTSLSTLSKAIEAYRKRFSREEMFRDFKLGGYNLEGCKVEGERLINLILVMTIAYTSATIKGRTIKRKGIQKYIGRVKEVKRTERRHSSFYIGLHAHNWVRF
ncbi:IS4 family transposase, partial [Moorena sp. SIO3I6]|uniref:IS4 family transposase n=1 Tax=Moorena sp. SIO3I6 TaxID=2607831 RepID=UPI0025CC63D6